MLRLKWCRRDASSMALVVLVVGAMSLPTASLGGPPEKVAAAIASLRNLDPSKVPEAEQEAFEKELDRAWSVLRKYRDVAEPAIREALSAEQTDSFFLIDLCEFMLHLDATREEVAAWLLKADPRANPGGYFIVAAQLASRGCQACLPAVIRMLELEELDTFIEEHALTVDLSTGLLFTIGPYGDGAGLVLADSLESPSCVVRRNAAELIYWMLLPDTPAALARQALEDPCTEARVQAWRTLGMLGEPSLMELVSRRLATDPQAPREEKLAMIAALQMRFYPSIRESIERLAADSDVEVRRVASEELANLAIREADSARLIANASSSAASGRAEVIRALERTRKRGFLEFEGSALELEAALYPEDLPLLNEARASVLRRVSDESLHEFEKLYLAATVLRQVLAQRAKPIGGADEQGGPQAAVSPPPR